MNYKVISLFFLFTVLTITTISCKKSSSDLALCVSKCAEIEQKCVKEAKGDRNKGRTCHIQYLACTKKCK